MGDRASNSGRYEKEDGSIINAADHLVSDWVVNDAQDNGVATAQRGAVSGESHYITAIIASYSANKAGTLTVNDGGSEIFTVDCYDNLVIPLPKTLKITEGNAVSAALDASGTGGDTGTVTLIGYTA